MQRPRTARTSPVLLVSLPDTYEVAVTQFDPVRIFFVIFISIFLIWLTVFHRKYVQYLLRIFLTKRFILMISVGCVLSLAVTYILYLYTQKLSLQRMQQEVKSIAIAVAPQFDPNDINVLRVQDDWKKSEWAKVVNKLREIRVGNKDLLYVYLLNLNLI